jgi:predicted dehydrogenase
MKCERLKIGVVGCGWAGRQAVLAAAAHPLTQVTAISDLDPSCIKATVDLHDIPHIHGPYRDLLANPEVDAVYLAVNPVMRHQMVLDTLATQKHVLVQKPHAVRAAQIHQYADAVQEGTILQFCYFMRHFPLNRRIHTAISQGAIGDPYHSRVFLKYNTQPPAEGITRWQQVYGQKGGVLAQHASHEVNLAWWWMGAPEPEWAFAIKHTVNPRYDGPEGPAEDYLSGLVGFKGGKTLQIDCSRWLHADIPTSIEVFGTQGAIHGRNISRYTISSGAAGTFDTEDQTEIDAPDDIPQHGDTPLYFYHEIEHFARAVLGEVKPEPDTEDAYLFMRILDGLYDSAASGEKIILD